MKLRNYLETTHISVADFSRRIGVSVQAVHRYMDGDRFPRPDVMQKILAASGGKVRAEDFYQEAGA